MILIDALMDYGTWPVAYWCHLTSDTSEAELIKFANSIGLKPEWFQDRNGRHPHYDLVASKRQAAIRAGAVEVSAVELVKRCYGYNRVIKPGSRTTTTRKVNPLAQVRSVRNGQRKSRKH